MLARFDASAILLNPSDTVLVMEGCWLASFWKAKALLRDKRPKRMTGEEDRLWIGFAMDLVSADTSGGKGCTCGDLAFF